MPNLNRIYDSNIATNRQLDCINFQSQANTTRLKLLSYNIQVGISSSRYRHYLTHSWKHVLPHPKSIDNLDRIASLVCEFDMVALQEVDAGSFRSYFINQIEYLAKSGDFPYWYYQTNRNLGRIAQHSNGLLSRSLPMSITEHKLPGKIPGRGVMEVCYGYGENSLVLFLVHLALSKQGRMKQLKYLSNLVNQHQHVVVMGDFNCQAQSNEMDTLLNDTELCEPIDEFHTYPSWQPKKNIDHILVTPTISIENMEVLNHAVSDHLPIAVEIAVPDSVRLG